MRPSPPNVAMAEPSAFVMAAEMLIGDDSLVAYPSNSYTPVDAGAIGKTS